MFFNVKKSSRRGARVIFGAALLGVIFVPSFVSAATVYLSSSSENVFKDDIFVVEARIISQEDLINAGEITVFFDKEKLEIKELSSGGSLFSVWLNQPAFSNEKGTVTFIGGTPNGFQGEDALILKIIFIAKEEGEAKLNFKDNTVLFLHDGKGTKINPWTRPLTLTISERSPETAPKDEWRKIIEEDNTPPDPFEAVVGKNPSLFNNQYFISFFTTDEESGISHYEVREGTGDFYPAESPYLLKNQSLKSVIEVRAVDMAGNERVAVITPEIATEVSPGINWKSILLWMTLLTFVVIVLALFLKKRRIKIKK